MLSNYLTTALRSIRKRPSVTLLNVAGLALGLAACLLIGLWVEQELSYDTFHPEADTVARVVFDGQLGDQRIQGPLSPAPLAPTLVRDYPDVETATRFRVRDDVSAQIGDRTLAVGRVLQADTSFFDVFAGFHLVAGDRETALQETDAVVVTHALAQQAFGTTDVLGQTLMMDDTVRRITGVLDEPSGPSHIDADAITPIRISGRMMQTWVANNYYTYAELRPGTSHDAFKSNLQEVVETYAGPQFKGAVGMELDVFRERGGQWAYGLQSLTDIHLDADSEYEIQAGGDRETVYAFLAIGGFILLIACINFMNLATARSAERATEVGMRKALGAGERHLRRQFLGEALATTLLAGAVAVGLASGALPLFNQVAGTSLGLEDLATPIGLLAVGGGTIVVGLIAGSYPAFVLSRFAPSVVLKSSGRTTSGGHGSWLRRGLVVLQFALSIGLIAGTLVIDRQFDYIQQKNLGFDKERVVSLLNADRLRGQADFVQRIEQSAQVMRASAAEPVFSNQTSSTGFRPDDAEDPIIFNYIDASAGFLETMGMTLLAGRTFDPSRPADSSAVLINRTAAERLGWDRPAGHTLDETGDSEGSFPVIGIVEDFHYQSMRQRVQPLVIRLRAGHSTVYARLAPGDPSAAIAELRNAWSKATTDAPFEYAFLDQTFAEQHRSTQRAGRLFGGFTGLALLIACFGLFGLAAYTAERRTKEIGIRKALGATATQVIALISKDFVQLVAIAFVMSAPLAYVAMSQWIERFAYRVDLGVGVFLLAGGAALLVALGTVSTHALQAARVNPAHSLRDE